MSMGCVVALDARALLYYSTIPQAIVERYSHLAGDLQPYSSLLRFQTAYPCGLHLKDGKKVTADEVRHTKYTKLLLKNARHMNTRPRLSRVSRHLPRRS